MDGSRYAPKCLLRIVKPQWNIGESINRNIQQASHGFRPKVEYTFLEDGFYVVIERSECVHGKAP
jgi:uncharacterized protein YacL